MHVSRTLVILFNLWLIESSNLDTAWTGLSRTQVLDLLSGPTHCCRSTESREDTQKVGLQYWEEEAEDRLSPIQLLSVGGAPTHTFNSPSSQGRPTLGSSCIMTL